MIVSAAREASQLSSPAEGAKIKTFQGAKFATQVNWIEVANWSWCRRATSLRCSGAEKISEKGGAEVNVAPQIAINVTETETSVLPRSASSIEHGSVCAELNSSSDSNANSNSVGDVHEVKGNFIALLRYNKLQDFYLGALIYSVMIIITIFQQPKPHSNVPEESKLNVVLWMLLASLAASALLLALVAFASKQTFSHNSNHFRPNKSKSKRKRRGLQTFGLILTLLILYLPNLVALSGQEEVGTFANRCHGHLFPVLALIYLQPLLLEGGPLNAKLICGLGAVIYLISWSWSFGLKWSWNWISASETAKLANSAPFAALVLLFALLKRRQFARNVTKFTFADASRLIQAKVSLEHQRQQQETLLLSVLPAYVADQVKRNMLRKMTSTNQANEQQQQQQQQDQQQQATPTNKSSLAEDQNELLAVNQQPQRHSFLIPSRITNAIQSGTNTNALQNNGPTQLGGSPQGGATGNSQARRGFNELHIRTYNNVSLLYGDIVGFTRLCTQLSSSQLVRVLNDLFSHFDHLAEKHKIMRIKILGDCYYGVGGIPEFAVMGAKSRASRNDNHAINCVNMGLDMIHYIRCLNVERASRGGERMSHSTSASADNNADNQQQQQRLEFAEMQINANPELSSKSAGNSTPLPAFELNMRIGIHTGHIHSGVIGLKKWQFDVWSNDVSIAMHCESSGVAGRVQVTAATIQQLNGAFSFEDAPHSHRDSFLAEKEIRTYLICERAEQQTALDTSRRKLSPGGAARSKPEEAWRAQTTSLDTNAGFDVNMDEEKIRAATIGTIKQTLLSSSFEQSFVSYGLAFNHPDINSISLEYKDPTIAKLYSQTEINSLAFEVISLFVLLALALTLLNLKYSTTKSASLLLASIVILLLAASLFIRTKKIKKQHPLMPKQNSKTGRQLLGLEEFVDADDHQVIRDKNQFERGFLSRVEKSFKPIKSIWTNLIELLSRNNSRSQLKSFSINSIYLAVISIQFYLLASHCCENSSFNYDYLWKSVSGDYYKLTVIIILMSIDSSVNLVSYRTKCIILAGLFCSQLLILLKPAHLAIHHYNEISQNNTRLIGSLSESHQSRAREFNENFFHSSNAFLLLLTIFCSFSFARQMEYVNKVNFLWRNRLNVDHEELEYISGINKVLLENILPSHVVQYYMSHPNEQLKNQLSTPSYMRMSLSNMRNLNNDLYHEQHDSVAVMFASIPHFYEFYDESDISKQGLGCIALLNEIICDFDKLLLKNKFSRIEKIKTIGSTYMAAAGLRPCYLTGSRYSTVSANLNVSGGGAAAANSCPPNSSSKFATRPPRAPHMVTSLSVASQGSSQMNYLSETMQTTDDERRLMMSQQKLNLICMVQFATSLMTTLNSINKQSFQVFKLRVGVNAGSVIAGVIGAQRPFYDIWGDCVNIASRMESLGEIGRIQVEEKTAKLLMESLCSESYSITRRGPIDVKGKGGMVTYFVDKKQPVDGSGVEVSGTENLPTTATGAAAKSALTGASGKNGAASGQRRNSFQSTC